MPPAVEAQSLNHWIAREISSSLLLKLQSLEQWLALIMKNWYYFYGACSLTVWWINKWSPSSSSYLKHHVLNHMKTIMSNKRDSLMPSLSLFAPFLLAFHWFLSIFPLDASDTLSTNRKEHRHTHTDAHTDTHTHFTDHFHSCKCCRFYPRSYYMLPNRANLSLTITCLLKWSLNSVFFFIALCSLTAPIAITLAYDKPQIYKAPVHSLFFSCSFSRCYFLGGM